MSMFKTRGNNSVGLLLLLIAVLMISTYATAQTGLHSNLMKGSIIEMQDYNIYICIGSRDGAKVGQELDIYVGAKPMIYKGPPSFERKHMGNIRIVETLDEHFARAILISGKAERLYRGADESLIGRPAQHAPCTCFGNLWCSTDSKPSGVALQHATLMNR